MVKTNIQTFTGEVEVLEEFYVGSNLVANDVATHVLTVNNTANDAKIKSDFFVGDGGLLSNIATTLQSIADQGNAASNVILFNSNTDVTGYKNVGFVTTSNVGIQNTAPTHTMSIGDKIIIDNNTDESQGESVMLVHGRISADRFQGDGGLLSNIATTLESIADQGNASSNVLIFNSNTDISGYRGVGFVTTSNVGIQNTNPGFNTLSVGSNLFVNIYGSNVLTVHGNAAVSNLLVSEFSVSPAHGLQHVTQEGRATNQTVQLTNTTTGLEVSSNINVAGEVILTNATKGLDVTSNIEIGGRLKFDTNVFVDTLRVADVAANIVTYDRTTGELLDSSGTFMNKFAVVSEQPPSDLFANATTVTNHGGYTLTTSNLATNSNTYNAFDGTANAWVSGDLAGGYIGGANVFLETNLTQLSNLHPTQFGDWLAIEFPYKTTLRHMKLTPLTAAQFPASANIYATNNDLTWTEVNYWSGRDPVTASNVQTITVNATEQFKKYALVATKAAGNSSNVALQDWQLFTESFSIDGGKVAMAQQVATGGETVVDQSGPHGRGVAPLKKYPEIAFESGKFDSNDSTNTYVQAGYTVTVSGFVNSSNHPWKAFNGIDSEVGMLLSGLNYDTNGNANTSGTTASRLSASDSTPYGEWLKLELPNKIKLDKYVFTSRNDATHWTQSVEAGQVWGSNNDSNWVHLHTITTSGFTGESQSASFNVQTDNYYKYYAFIVTKTFAAGSDYYLCIPELKYYGYEEDSPAGDTSVDTTFTSIMNTPQTTGAQVYVDGSLGGNANTNRVVGPAAANTAATYDATGKYWELNGTLTSNISVEANTFLSGDAPHSLSMWFNSSNLVSNASNSCIFSLGTEERFDHVGAAFSNNYQTVQKLLSSDLEANDRFGFAVAMNSDGTKFIVGAYIKDDDVGNIADAGAAYIYTYNGSSWDEQKLMSPDIEASSHFGTSVAMSSDGTRVIVGAARDDEGATDTGAAYIYTYNGSSWDAGTKIVALDKEQEDRFGFSVAMSGDGNRVIVGAYIEDHNVAGGVTLASAGSAYIYTYDGSSWDTGTKIVASDRAVSDIFGRSVAINSDGTKAIVGADGGEAAYIFTYNGSSWVQQQILVASDAAAGDEFGRSVAINSNGTKVIVGADGGEAAYIFTYNGSSWVQQQILVASDAAAGDKFGYSVAMNSDGTKVIVGAYLEHAGDITDTGAAYIFAYDGSNWDTGLKITAPDKEASDQFGAGTSVAMSGDGARVVVGANLDDVFSANSGTVYVYDRDTTHHLMTDLKLQSNTWHNLTYAYQGEGGSRVTYLDGRKVAEDQAEDTFGDYPPFAMTGYSQGGYVASANHTRSGYHPYDAFDNETNDDDATSSRWWSSADVFSGNVYNGITSDHCGSFQGAYLKLQLPYKLICSHVNLWLRDYNNGTTPNPQSPRDFKIVGSNDDINWVELKDEVSFVDTGNVSHPVIVNATKGYKYLAIVVTRVNSSTLVSIMDVEYYGHRENDLVRLPDPTNVLKYPHIAMTGPAQRGYVVEASHQYATSGDGAAYNVFNTKENTWWGGYEAGNAARYTSPNFTYTGGGDSVSLGDTGISGEYIVLKLPYKITLSSLKLIVDDNINYAILHYTIVGSNNGTNWFTIKDVSGLTTSDYTASDPHTTTTDIVSSTAYSQIGLIVRQTSAATQTAIEQIQYYGTGVDSIPIQIGGGNIDKVANFRVYDKFVGEDQALEIWDAQKDEFGRAKSSMTLHKGRLGIGTTEPEGRLAVADEPHNLEEFPPRAMTDYKTYFEGHGEFCASASSLYIAGGATTPTYVAYQAFDRQHYINSWSSITWNSVSPSYNISTGLVSTDASLGGYSGEWLKLSLPYGVKISGYQLAIRSGWSNYCPDNWVILGSNNDKNWDLVSSVTTGRIAPGTNGDQVMTKDFNVETTKYYKYLALVCSKVAGPVNQVNFAELRYFGTREQGQSVLHDGQLTLTKNLTVPRIGPALDADDTPRRDRLVVEYNTSTNPTFERTVRDTSGRGVDGTLVGTASYDATEKAFTFPGTVTNNIYTGNLGPNIKGNQQLTVSLWFKTNDDRDQSLFSILPGDSDETTNKVFQVRTEGNSTNYNLSFIYWSSDYRYNVPALDSPQGKWFHLVAMNVGGTKSASGTTFDRGDPSNRRLFLNGVELFTPSSATYGSAVSGTASALLDLEPNSRLIIGSRYRSNGEYPVDGSISNFKLYDTALTTEEVKTLYDMGRCDEGHHVVNFSKTRVGIGLGDGEAPRGALDVRGDIHGGCPAFWSVYNSASKAGEGYVLFNTVRNGCIKNASLDGTTGKITIQIAGWYKLDVHGMSYEIVGTTGADTASVGRIVINDSVTSSYIYTRMGIPSGVGVHQGVSGQSVHYLNVGDVVGYKLSNDTNNSFYGNGYSDFSGFLLST